jgi:acetyltransferase-like isoleucine patch superfamily enzyme
VTITDTDFHPLDPAGRRYCKDDSRIRCAPVRLEDNVFVGAGSTILKGVTIGRNSVIGAGSIVTKSIPANVVAAGNPCRPIGKLAAMEMLACG